MQIPQDSQPMNHTPHPLAHNIYMARRNPLTTEPPAYRPLTHTGQFC